MNRVSTAALLVSCLLAGYALTGTRVSAIDDVSQVRQLPNGLNIGTHVTLTFAVNSLGNSSSQVECSIMDVSQGWVRCPADDSTR